MSEARQEKRIVSPTHEHFTSEFFMTKSSIITQLKKDHQEVTALLEEALNTQERSGDKRQRLFAQIQEALNKHMQFEEEKIYPVLEKKRKTQGEALEALEEHRQIKYLLEDIDELDVRDKHWKAKISVLAEDIRHHINEEEEDGGLFDELRAALQKSELVALGEDYQMTSKAAAH
jgi:hemerythrin superfamily protein